MRIVASLILITAIAITLWFFEYFRPSGEPATPPVSTLARPGSEAGTQNSTSAASLPAQTAAAPAPSSVTAASNPAVAKVERQAKKFVAKLTAPEPTPIQVEKADNFVTGDQLFSLIPKSASQETTVKDVIEDKSLQPQSAITIVKHIEQVQRVSPEKLIASSAGNLDQPVKQLIDEKVVATTVRKVLAAAGKAPDKPIDIVTNVDYYEQTTPAELSAELKSNDGLKAKSIITVIKKPHGLEAASMGELMRAQKPTPGITDSPEQKTVIEDQLFYVRTVRPDDAQGIWGIVQEGIIKNFARGMAVRRGREINTYKVDIPRDSDEMIAGKSSSFLGKLIYRKTTESYVFNFRQNRMGRNPNRIRPGQEIVIINFKPEELIGIYKHFVAQRG